MTHANQGDQLLYQPFKLGRITLANRMVMAPLTRSRAEAGNVPGPLTVTYYQQRASVGLVIAEATQMSAEAQGYVSTPGVHSAEQVAGWKKVTDAVHAAGGKIFVQLWHTGRISHTYFQPGHVAPGAPSAIAAQAQTYIPGEGFAPTSTPRALSIPEIKQIVADFRSASRNAIEAGFDGVEIHGAHGYLLDAFLREAANQRTDEYGGSIENRARLLLEVMQAAVDEIGADRVGIRLSPVSPVNDTTVKDPQPLFEYVVKELNKLQPVYIHVVEGHTGGPRDNIAFNYEAIRALYQGVWMVNNGYTQTLAEEAVSTGHADLVSFGRLMISNPDLVRRFKEGASLNKLFEDAPLYGGEGAHGYTDYPALTA